MQKGQRWTRLRRLAAAGALLVAGLLLGLALQAPAPPSAGVERAAQALDAAVDLPVQAPPVADQRVGPALPQAAADGASTLPPLPAADLPLVAQLNVLTVRAEAGDGVAGCRLLVAVNRCREAIRHQRFTALMRRRLEERATTLDDLLVNVIASAELRAEQLGGFCEGVETTALPAAEDMLSRFLPHLDVRQRVVLALSRADGQLNRLRGRRAYSESSLYVYPQVLADHAIGFLHQGLAARDPLALEGLVMLHAPGRAAAPTGTSPWLPNARLFLRYALLLDRLYGPESLGREARELVRAAAATLPADALARLRTEVAGEAQAWRAAAAPQSARSVAPDAGEEAASHCAS